MSILTNTELAAMRVDVAELLPDTCVIYFGTTVPDGQGGGTVAWTADGTAACRLDSVASGRSNGMGGRLSQLATALVPQSGWTLTVLWDTHIRELAQVVHGGNTYTVTSVDDDKSWPVVLRAHLERVP